MKHSNWAPHWFSRRHETPAAFRAYQAKKQDSVSQFFATLGVNQRTRAARSPQQQLALLDAGGFRAVKERARLKRQIEVSNG